MTFTIAKTKENATIIAALAINPVIVSPFGDLRVASVARVSIEDEETIAHMVAGQAMSMGALSLKNGRVHMATIPLDPTLVKIEEIIKF